MDTKRRSLRRERLLAAALIFLALVPSLAGAVRLGDVVSGGEVTAANARFHALPVPILLHIVGALAYSILGAFQFLPALRARHPRWHRRVGRYVVVPAGFLVSATGLWMTAVYEMPPVDGAALAAARYAVGVLMGVFLLLGIAAIARKDIPAHGAWMIRAYALALGAGTQVFTSAPFLLIFGEPGVTARAVQMIAGWLINAAVAEWVIRRRRAGAVRPRRAAEASPVR
ncbi:DUF2306 domain-containing protein [Zhihengliuella halotolerans]|uniref:Putative membrane protein DUF2306 n=1 Tax=Zhihengliuella halotolerans TaxID=370736 RepID=A0A4V2GA89_9MICC|nr:DUF2306 domain-containing protein [Zhihengliuella halotolerans]RZU63366.1 putative membrane protein DUF2306 [Zhihengliuella halotolerans]